ncbi:MAG: helix-turn-helix transcriptional regulator [Desulfoferrobacter sp.]
MLGLTKKHHTESVELKFIGPQENKGKAIEALKSFGFVDVSESVPWRACFPDLTDEQLPGILLKGARGKEGHTQKELSKITGIPQRHISEMENDKRPIGKEIAKRLAEALNVDYRIFL